MSSLDVFRGHLFAAVSNVFRRYGKAAGNRYVSVCTAIAVVVIAAVGISIGLDQYEKESSISNLYIITGTRLENEYEFHNDNWGVAGRQMAIIEARETEANPNATTLTKVGLDATISVLIPMLKYHEVDKCPTFDDTANTAAIEASCNSSQSYAQFSLYCSCMEVAASPNMVYINRTKGTVDENGAGETVKLSTKDMCDTPRVPPELGPSQRISYRYDEPEFAAAGGIYNSTLAALLNNIPSSNALSDASVEPGLTFQANKEEWASLLFTQLAANETAFQGTASVDAGRTNFFQSALFASQHPSVLAALGAGYNNSSDPNAYVTAAVGYLIESVAQAIMASQFNFVAEGNLVGYAIQEIANCMANYVGSRGVSGDINNTGVIFTANVLPVVTSLIADPCFAGIVGGDANTITAAIMSAAYGAVGATLATTPNATTAQLGQAVLQGLVTPALSPPPPTPTVVPVDSTNSSCFVPPATPSATLLTVARLATEMVLTELGHQRLAPFSRLPWDLATVNFTARPLPRKWGVDRLPCLRLTILDMFKEGDFDYPYALKQVAFIGSQMYAFSQLSYLQVFNREADCTNASFVRPVKDALYYSALVTSYQSENSLTSPTAGGTQYLAIQAAEQTLTAAAGIDLNSFTEAANARVAALVPLAIGAFFTAGGQYFDAANNAWEPHTTLRVECDIPAGNYNNLAALLLLAGTKPGNTAASIVVSSNTFLNSDATLADFNTIEAAFNASLATGSTDTAVMFGAFFAVSAASVNLTDSQAFFQIGFAALSEASIMGTWAASTLGPTLVRALKTESGLVSFLDTIQQGFAAFGYMWRPSYGSHRLAALGRQVTSIKAAVDDAVNAYYNTLINPEPNNETHPAESTAAFNPQMCLVGNTDPTTLTGETLQACYVPWIARPLLNPALSIGQTVINNGSLSNLPPSGITSVINHRVLDYSYASFNPVSAEHLNSVLEAQTTQQQRRDMHLDFEKRLIEYQLPFWQRDVGTGFASGEEYENQTWNFAVDRSTGDIVSEATEPDDVYLAICYIVMIVYVGLTMIKISNAVESHFTLGVVGVVVIALATFTSIMFSSWFGIKSTPVVTQVIPFVALGIGVDDMLVLAQAYMRIMSKNIDVSLALGEVLAEAGPSVTFTTMTNFVAFMVASITPINVVSWFAYMLSVAVITNWLFLMLLFVPIMRLDAVRTSRGWREFGSCGKTSEKSTEGVEHTALSRWFGNIYGPFLMKPVVKGCVICSFLGFFTAQTYLWFEEVEYGTRNSDIVSDGTYQKDFYTRLEDYYLLYGGDFTTQSLDFNETNVQVGIMMASRNLMMSKWIDSVGANKAGGTFLEDVRAEMHYSDWVNTTVCTRPDNYCLEEAPGTANDTLCTTYSTTPPSEFYYALGSWFSKLGGLEISSFVCTVNDPSAANHGSITDCANLDDAWPTTNPNRSQHSKNVTLYAFKSSSFILDQKYSVDFVEAIKDTRDRVDACNNMPTQNVNQTGERWTFIAGYTYNFYAQYLHVRDDLYKIGGYAILGVALVTLVFQFSLRSSLILSLVILMVAFEVGGVLAEIPDINLNAFSLVNICIGIGMGIEFTAHIVHHFMIVEGSTRDERVVLALEFMGPPMVHGAVTSFIALLFLVTSDLAFIRNYYFGMFFVLVLIAAANGLVLLPVLLSLFGDSTIVIPQHEKMKRDSVTSQNVVMNPTHDKGPKKGKGHNASLVVGTTSMRMATIDNGSTPPGHMDLLYRNTPVVDGLRKESIV